jgi:hypothetical protein
MRAGARFNSVGITAEEFAGLARADDELKRLAASIMQKLERGKDSRPDAPGRRARPRPCRFTARA